MSAKHTIPTTSATTTTAESAPVILSTIGIGIDVGDVTSLGEALCSKPHARGSETLAAWGGNKLRKLSLGECQQPKKRVIVATKEDDDEIAICLMPLLTISDAFCVSDAFIDCQFMRTGVDLISASRRSTASSAGIFFSTHSRPLYRLTRPTPAPT